MNDLKRDLTVFVVDDDPAIRDSLALLLSLRGYRTSLFASAEDFLGAVDQSWSGCVMADLRLPGMGGLELLTELQRRELDLPVVVITGHGDVQTARAAFRSNAVDFLEKPFDEEGPITAIEAAFVRESERLAVRREQQRRNDAVGALSAREKSVASLLALGVHNSEVGKKLGISPRTVEVHKARIMAKLGARNIAELIRVMEAKSR